MAHGAGTDHGAGRPEDARGLTGGEAANRLRRDGPNTPPPRRTVPVRLLASAFASVFTLLLWSAALLALIGGMPGAAAVTAVAAAVHGGAVFVQEYRADRIGQRLLSALPASAAVVRDGRRNVVDAAGLVVGDVVLLAAGDRVAADLRLTAAHSLVVDESPRTGRGATARPSRGAVVHAGTLVVEGAAEGVVTATGVRARRGAAASGGADRPTSPLIAALRDLVAFFSVAAAGIGVLLFGASSVLGVAAPDGFLLAVGVVVAVVPQGLSASAALSLARTAQRLADRGALVRRPEAVEVFGSVSFVCTAMTGPVTGGEPSVVEVWTPAGAVRVEGDGHTPRGELFGAASAVAAVRALAETAVLGSEGGVRFTDGGWRPVGDPVEAALHVLAARAGARRTASPVLRRHPFDPRRRRSSAVTGDAVHVRGAVDAVLPRCWNGEAAYAAAAEMAERGLRVLAIARRGSVDPGGGADDAERDLTLLGVAGLEDPPRPGASSAVARCRRAGVRVALVTGEQPGTARAVACAAGLAAADVLVLTGPELPHDLRELGELVDRDGVVVALASPEDRLRVTVALQHRGHSVAVVCGGAEDGPALRRADVGAAPGRSGSDAAREAADLVLLDGRFPTVVAAIELGRTAFRNLRGLLTHRFLSGTAETVPFLVWAVTGGAVPLALGVLQVVALDVGVGLLPALALGAEPSRPGALRGGPGSGRVPVDRRLAFRVLVVLGPVVAAVSMFAFVVVLWTGRWAWGEEPRPLLLAAASGTAFATVGLGLLAAALACRSQTEPFDAVPWSGGSRLLVAVGAGAAALWVFLALPPLSERLGGAFPPGFAWPAVLAVVPALLAADSVHKVVREAAAARAPTGPGAAPG